MQQIARRRRASRVLHRAEALEAPHLRELPEGARRADVVPVVAAAVVRRAEHALQAAPSSLKCGWRHVLKRAKTRMSNDSARTDVINCTNQVQ